MACATSLQAATIQPVRPSGHIFWPMGAHAAITGDKDNNKADLHFTSDPY